MYMAKTDGWYLERVVFLIAGVMAGLSAVLAWQVSPWWLILTALISVNLIIFAVSGFCLMANILYKLGIRPRLQRGRA
jgi:hypothetical protein